MPALSTHYTLALNLCFIWIFALWSFSFDENLKKIKYWSILAHYMLVFVFKTTVFWFLCISFFHRINCIIQHAGSVSQFSRLVMSNSLWPHELQHTRPPCPSPTPRAYSNSHPSSRWCHPAISFSVMPFLSCLQSFPASGSSFPVSQFFPSGGQRIRISASAPVLPMNVQAWFPLGWTGWISLLSKGLLRAFSNTTVQKHQFFGA